MRNNTKLNYQRAVSQAISYIEENLEQEICLDKIAAHSGYSKYHLNRLFTEIVGCTIYKYIQKRRLDNAARKLVDTKEPIIEIAFNSGYGSQQAFTLAFRRQYLLTPQQYRVRSKYLPGQMIYNSICAYTLLAHSLSMTSIAGRMSA